MLKYNKKGRRHSAMFLAPDDGGGSGGSGEPSGQTQGNSGQQQEPAAIDPKLFDQIPIADLDDDTKKVIEQIKTAAIATSQQVQTLRSQNENLVGQARSFQSAADRANAELKKLAPRPQDAEDPILKVVEKTLRDSGYNDKEIERLAPTFVGMFKGVNAVQRETIGKDLQPLVGTVLHNQATTAFQEAMANDPMEMLKIPEVANEVWKTIRERAMSGKETNADIVLNFAKMAWHDHHVRTKANGGTPPAGGTLPVNPPSMHTGGFPFVAGTAISSIAPTVPNPNAPRTQMNEDTREAVATSVKHMLKGFEGKIKLPAGLDMGKKK